MTDHPLSLSAEGRESNFPFLTFFLLAARATADTSSVDAMILEDMKKRMVFETIVNHSCEKKAVY